MRAMVAIVGLAGLLAACGRPAVAQNQPRCEVEMERSPLLYGGFPDLDQESPASLRRKIKEYAQLSGRAMDWVYLPNHWQDSTDFPAKLAAAAHAHGAVPVVRIEPRSVDTHPSTGPDPVYTLDRFAAGDFDSILHRYAEQVKAFAQPVWIEFGTEVNGDWFPWNGKYNGEAAGPGKFRHVYRRIVGIFRSHGVTNVRWVYHVNAQSRPRARWNTMAAYYPGDDVVDLIFVSVFGAQTVAEPWGWFSKIFPRVYREVTALSADKPIVVGEMGVTEFHDRPELKARWLDDAFKSLTSARYPRVHGVGYWHEGNWQPATATPNNLRIDSSPATLAAYREGVARLANPAPGCSR